MPVLAARQHVTVPLPLQRHPVIRRTDGDHLIEAPSKRKASGKRNNNDHASDRSNQAHIDDDGDVGTVRCRHSFNAARRIGMFRRRSWNIPWVLGVVVISYGTWSNLGASISQPTIDILPNKNDISGVPLQQQEIIERKQIDNTGADNAQKKTIETIKEAKASTISRTVDEAKSTTTTVGKSTGLNNVGGDGGVGGVSGGSSTKIVGFADAKYKEIAVTWYQRLQSLGYTEHVIIAVDEEAEAYFRDQSNQQLRLRYERLQYQPCLTSNSQDTRKYRRQLFGRRWKYIFDSLVNGTHVLLTDVDNVFSRYLPMSEMEQSSYDVYHAYSTAYPGSVFFGMGFTVCGGMGWYRATKSVRQFIGTLLNKCNCWKSMDCNCYCDDQVVLNELLWKGKHSVTWTNSNGIAFHRNPKDFNDLHWDSITGISSKTQHTIKIWDRNIAYRAPMPQNSSSCPSNNWVSMPLYVDRSVVTQTWDETCNSR